MSAREEQVLALGRLGAEVLSGLTTVSADMHSAIAEQTFGVVEGAGRRLAGPGAAAAVRPVRAAHRLLTRSVYVTVAATGGAAARGVAALAARLGPESAIEDAPPVVPPTITSAVNGMWGDHLDARHPALSLDMTARLVGDVSSRLAVFVHGLCESDTWWHPGEAGRSFGERLVDDTGHTSVYVTYNTGLRVADNGRRLAALLSDLTSTWPVEVEDVVLVGHSMGGLVARSASHYAHVDAHDWLDRLSQVITLGTPHLGAPLEQAVHVMSWALGLTPQTRPLARVLDGRSAGVKDLRFGAIVEQEQLPAQPASPLAHPLTDTTTDPDMVPGVTYRYVGATIASDPDSLAGRLIGDALVLPASGAGAGRRRQVGFAPDAGTHLGGLHHFSLLTHHSVYDLLKSWLTSGPPPEDGVERLGETVLGDAPGEGGEQPIADGDGS